MSGQQIIYGVGVQLVQPLVDLISILDLRNILGRSQDVLPVEDRSYLFQAERILLNGKGAVDGANTITPAQSRVAGKLVR